MKLSSGLGSFKLKSLVRMFFVVGLLAVADHPRAGTADPKDFIDNRFLKELEESGFIHELYPKK